MSGFDVRVGELILQTRKQLAMPQTDLAEAIGLTRTSVSNIERGKQSLSLSLFCKVAIALHEEPEQFLARLKDEKHPRLTIEEVEDDDVRQEIDKILLETIGRKE